MYYYKRKHNLYNQEMQDGQRILDPDTIVVPAGYQVEVAVEGLDSLISIEPGSFGEYQEYNSIDSIEKRVLSTNI